jgi:nicotinamide-nucleotide amidase
MVQEALEVELGEWLRKRGLKLVAAESCTGGLIGHRITDIPGSSEYYLGSITAYAYEAKERLLGVRHETLTNYGAVSEQTVIEMARGARHALAGAVPLDQTIGVSVSGIAGPGGGMPGKPVGLTWIGLSVNGFEMAWQYVWNGSRSENKDYSASQALRLVLDYLQGRMEMGYERVEVTAHWQRAGVLVPEKVYWQDKTYFIESTGRSWEDSDGIHILCMLPGGQVMELLFKLNPAGWFMKKQASTTQMA